MRQPERMKKRSWSKKHNRRSTIFLLRIHYKLSIHFGRLDAQTSDRPSYFWEANPLNSPDSPNLFLCSSSPDISLVTGRTSVGWSSGLEELRNFNPLGLTLIHRKYVYFNTHCVFNQKNALLAAILTDTRIQEVTTMLHWRQPDAQKLHWWQEVTTMLWVHY